MDSLLSIFLLFIAGITALLTYLVVPYVPVLTLVSVAAILLAAGIWWHWTQFALDYKGSTWQETLRSYASYALVAVVILLSYAYYVIVVLNDTPATPNTWRNTSRNSSRNISQNVRRNTSPSISSIPSIPSILPIEEPARATNRNIFA